jgi:hypothetical protein
MRTAVQKKAKRNRLDECIFEAHAMLAAARTGTMIFTGLGKDFSHQAKTAVLIFIRKGFRVARG